MARKIHTTHNLDALTRDELVIAKAGRDAWDAITKTFATWIVLGEAIVMLRNKAHVIGGGRKTFQRLRDQNGFGKIDGGEISRLEKIMANLDAVRGWHAKLPQNKQVEWASPSSVIRHALNADGSRLFPPKKKGGSKTETPKTVPSVAAKDSELEAAQERIKELHEELAAAKQAAKSKPPAVDGSDFESWPLAARREFVNAVGLDVLVASAAPAEKDKLRKGGIKTIEAQQPSGDFEALRSAYAAAVVAKLKEAKSTAARKRIVKEENAAMQAAMQAARSERPADPSAKINAGLRRAFNDLLPRG